MLKVRLRRKNKEHQSENNIVFLFGDSLLRALR